MACRGLKMGSAVLKRKRCFSQCQSEQRVHYVDRSVFTVPISNVREMNDVRSKELHYLRETMCSLLRHFAVDDEPHEWYFVTIRCGDVFRDDDTNMIPSHQHAWTDVLRHSRIYACHRQTNRDKTNVSVTTANRIARAEPCH